MKASTDDRDSMEGWVRIIWIDCAGVRRCRVVRRSRLEDVKYVGLAYACLFLPCDRDVPPPVPSAAPVGEMRLKIDASSLISLPWRPRDAMALALMDDEEGRPWECCPRGTLSKALRLLQQEFGVKLICGFEIEFNLLKQRNAGDPLPIQAIDDCSYCQTLAMENAACVLEGICSHLEAAGLTIVQVHPESANGQFEIALLHREANNAADDLIVAKETISAIALKNGCIVSFLPKIYPEQAGNGCHCHFSLQGKVGNAMVDPNRKFGLSDIGESFAAGILHHLPSLMCFTAPNPNSYKRISPSSWSGAFQCWGINNREVPLRMISQTDKPDSLNFELKAMDATANPYLAMTALIAAGIGGIRYHMKLPDNVQVDPATLTIPAAPVRLPTSLSNAIYALECDLSFQETFDSICGSETLRQTYVAVKQSESSTLQDLSLDQQVQMLLQRF